MLDIARADLADRILPAFLRGKRWFQAKGQTLSGVRVDLLRQWPETAEGGWHFLCLATATFAATPPQTYFVPLLRLPERPDAGESPAVIGETAIRGTVWRWADALSSARFVQRLVTDIRRGTRFTVPEGTLQGMTFPNWPTDGIGRQIVLPALEQSHSAAILDDAVFAKFYRRLPDGICTEREMGLFLTEEAAFTAIAPVIGSLEWQGSDGSTRTLGLFQKRVPNQGDAWTRTLEILARWLPGQGNPEAAALTGAHDRFLHRLGDRLGGLHRSLAQPSRTPGFGTALATPGNLRDWQQATTRSWHETLDRLAERLSALPEASRRRAETLLSRREGGTRGLADALPEGLATAVSRIHGDLHLGQILLNGEEPMIIDFEGEPGRTTTERRALESPLRDVAGMLRSFSYAAHMALNRAGGDATMGCRAAEWEAAAAETFLEGYRTATTGVPTVPSHPAAVEALLRLFCLDKALYELRYEIDNRPDWADIPLAGLLDLSSAFA